MREKPKIGLLPLYLKLYDERIAEMRKVLEPFLQTIAERFEKAGVVVKRAPICRIEVEFDEAVESFETESVDIIVTIHLAYSPSLESVEALTRTSLPVLILDTTIDYDFGLGANPERILYNHGIHGVQDLASMLRRCEKPFQIVAGHVTESDVIGRAMGIAEAAYGANSLAKSRALRIGEPFRGMGDFAVGDGLIEEAFEVSVEEIEASDLIPEVESVSEEEIEAEMTHDQETFVCEATEEVRRRSTKVGLGLRQCLERGGYGAFSLNFLAFDSSDGPVNTVPFLEVAKAMARGIGYAGEGDILTASLVGALSRAFGKTTFTEIFCPDWKGNALFLSHMGEINPEVAAEKPLLYEKVFPFTDALNPAAIACGVCPGPAVLVNLAPGPNETFDLLVAPVEVLGDATHPEMRTWIRGWVRPRCELGRFLEEYSQRGGTHHSALVLGDRTQSIKAFAAFTGIGCHVIGE